MITDRKIDQAFADLRAKYGGRRDDYFGLLHLEEEHRVPHEKAVNQIAFGGNDYGVDGFYFDEALRNLYIFQFKYTACRTGAPSHAGQRIVGVPTLALYSFRFRDPLTGKWIRARHRLETPEIQRRYAEWELIGEPVAESHMRLRPPSLIVCQRSVLSSSARATPTLAEAVLMRSG